LPGVDARTGLSYDVRGRTTDGHTTAFGRIKWRKYTLNSLHIFVQSFTNLMAHEKDTMG